MAEEVCPFTGFGYDGKLRHISSRMPMRHFESAYLKIALQAVLQVGILACPFRTTAFMRHY
jgi:hypothetical protein